MLLRRSLFVLDIFVLLAIAVFLVVLPAERCAHFETKQGQFESNCHVHPVHFDGFTFVNKSVENKSIEAHEHWITVCHQLQWSHYAFWENMYLVLIPAVIALFLIVCTVCEIFEFDLFIGRIPSTSILVLSIFAVIYTIGVISHEKNRIQTEWPFLRHVQILGAAKGTPVDVTVPATWQYSILMCILSALFKIGRVLIQHFFGDKKFSFDESDVDTYNGRRRLPTSDDNENGNLNGILNESKFSRIEEN